MPRQPSETETPLSAGWKSAFAVAVVCSTAVKLYLAYATRGSADVEGFAYFLEKIRALGGVEIYTQYGIFGGLFNHPPFIVRYLRALGWLADATRVPFRFWLRAPCVAADLLTFWAAWRVLGPDWRRETANRVAFLVLLLNPVSIWISGFHGNFDPLMICCVVLSIYLLERRGSAALGGLAYGAALGFKIVPAIFAPAFFLSIAGARRRAIFFLSAAAYFFVASVPYLLEAPVRIARAVLGYSSLYGNWGWTWVLVHLLRSNPHFGGDQYYLTPRHALVQTFGKCLLLAALLAASVWMNRRREKPALFFQCGALAFLFMFLTPGYGAQYQAWLIPWIVLVGLVPLLLHLSTNGTFLTLAYGCWEFSNPYEPPCRDVPFKLLTLACWLTTLVVLVFYLRALRPTRAGVSTG